MAPWGGAHLAFPRSARSMTLRCLFPVNLIDSRQQFLQKLTLFINFEKKEKENKNHGHI